MRLCVWLYAHEFVADRLGPSSEAGRLFAEWWAKWSAPEGRLGGPRFYQHHLQLRDNQETGFEAVGEQCNLPPDLRAHASASGVLYCKTP